MVRSLAATITALMLGGTAAAQSPQPLSVPSPNALPQVHRATPQDTARQRPPVYAGQRPASAPATYRPGTYSQTQARPAAKLMDSRHGMRSELRIGYDQIGEESGFDGVLYGSSFGYDVAFGDRAFFGVFASLDATTAEGSDSAITNIVGASTETTAVEATSGLDVEIGTRAGYWLTDAWNVYGSLGYAISEINTKTTITTTDGVTTTVEQSSDSTAAEGLRVGAGSEYIFRDRIYGKAEYRYTDFDGDAERHQVVTGVGMRF